eukprot:753965-Hanusia_phi.AAC.2
MGVEGVRVGVEGGSPDPLLEVARQPRSWQGSRRSPHSRSCDRLSSDTPVLCSPGRYLPPRYQQLGSYLGHSASLSSGSSNLESRLCLVYRTSFHLIGSVLIVRVVAPPECCITGLR